MNTAVTTSVPADLPESLVVPTGFQQASVFWEWCLRREALRLFPQLVLVAPIVVVELFALVFWPERWQRNQGRPLLQILFVVAALQILASGAIHASQAICWEVSQELRELVRLTGIGPVTLLCSKVFARWLTIGCSILLLLPLVFFAITLGGVTTTQLIAFGWCLLMLAVLMAGMAILSGMSATEAQNAPTTAAMGTFLLILLYHLAFWFAAALISLTNWLIWGESQISSGWMRWGYDFAWQTAPVTVIGRTLMAPELMSPWSPSYWIHFIVAACAFRMASVLMIIRFRSLRRTTEFDSDSSATSTNSRGTGRPRCTDAPLFWKDAYILGGGSRSKRRSWVIFGLIAVSLIFIGASTWDWDLPLVVGIVAECVMPVLFSVRFDSLISAEFRQQTWHSLMLLPIDRRTLLWAKLRAVRWQLEPALVPLGIAVAFAFPRAPMVLFMVAVIAILAGMLLCQVSALYYLTARHWVADLVRALLATALIVLCVVLWFSFPPWVSFFMTVLLLAVTVVPTQNYIEEQLQNWTEASYRETDLFASGSRRGQA